MKTLLKKLAQRFGYDIQHLPTDPLVRQQFDLLNQYKINLIFDIGANKGQYALRMRKNGYKGRIVSFEPLPDAFRSISNQSSHDPLWEVVETAIGSVNESAEIYVSENSHSSSMLEMTTTHLESAPDAFYTGQIPIGVQRIDSLISQYFTPDSRLFIKIDTQGFEQEVVKGAINSMSVIHGFQMELSLIPLYKNEMLFSDMVELMRNHGYFLRLIEAGHRHHKSGELLQVEGHFFKSYA